MLTSHLFGNNVGVKHGFFPRSGGVSSFPYDSLNCGFGSGDTSENIISNRAIAMHHLDLTPSDLNTLQQVHSTDIAFATKKWTQNSRPIADGIITQTLGLAIGVLTADCAPILLLDDKAMVAAACHAGWRGAVNGVIDECISGMEVLGAKREQIDAVIGPCIHQESYEVGIEFKDFFFNKNRDNSKFFKPSVNESHWLFDLPGFVRWKLSQAELQNVFDISIDTYKDEGRFYSYRRSTQRGENFYGRNLSAIVLGN